MQRNTRKDRGIRINSNRIQGANKRSYGIILFSQTPEIDCNSKSPTRTIKTLSCPDIRQITRDHTNKRMYNVPCHGTDKLYKLSRKLFDVDVSHSRLGLPNNRNSIKRLSTSCKIVTKICCVKKRSSYNYVNLLACKFNNVDQARDMIKGMTKEEVSLLKTKSYNQMIDDLWLDKNIRLGMPHITNILREREQKLSDVLSYVGLNNIKTEGREIWEFPKGSRENNDNSPLDTALRELEEETQISSKDVEILNPEKTIVHIFKGTNDQYYVSEYFVGLLKTPIKELKKQSSDYSLRGTYVSGEIGDMRWVEIDSLDQYMDKDRLYCCNLAKKYLNDNA